MYSVTHRDTQGLTGVYCRIKRLDDNTWWNEATDTWDATASASCDVSLPATSAGVYSGSATFTPSQASIYEIHVFDTLATPIIVTRIPYLETIKTALQLVNAIQADLRMPPSADFTRPHARLVLSQINKAITLAIEQAEWPEAISEGTFYTKALVPYYTLRPVSAASVDKIKNLQISGYEPITHRSDEVFRSIHGDGLTTGQPTDYRIVARVGRDLVIEFSPTPDAAYAIDFSAVIKAATLVNTTDVPIYDPDILQMGGYAFTRKEQGETYQDDLAAYQAKLKMNVDNQSEPNWGDAEPV